MDQSPVWTIAAEEEEEDEEELCVHRWSLHHFKFSSIFIFGTFQINISIIIKMHF